MDKLEAITKNIANLQKIVEERNRITAIQDTVKAVDQVRKGEFSLTDALPGMSPELNKMQDELYIASVILRKSPTELRFFNDYQNEIKKTVNTMGTGAANLGTDWVPTQFSSDLIGRVALELKVAALHNRFTMPSPVFTYPVLGGKPTAYIQSETVTDAGTNKPVATNVGTNKITFTAVKLAVRVMTSTELTEDSIVPVLPQIRQDVINALAEGQENAVLNGDTTATHMDTDIEALGATNVCTAWKGYRKFALAGSYKQDLATFNTANLRKMRALMGKYGVNPANLAWVVSINGYNKMLGLTEVLTMDKYGNNMTLLSGELGRFDGIPIVVSEFCRDDVDANGVNGVSGNTKGVLHLVYKPGFMFGDRRQITAKTFDDIQVDQLIIVVTQRLDFQPLYDPSTEEIVSLGYNFS